MQSEIVRIYMNQEMELPNMKKELLLACIMEAF